MADYSGPPKKVELPLRVGGKVPTFAELLGLPLVTSAYRYGVFRVQWDEEAMEPVKVIMSQETVDWLLDLESRGGRNWDLALRMLANLITDVKTDGRSLTGNFTDLHLPKVRQASRAKPSQDRVTIVCGGITDLVSQMAPMLDGRALDVMWVEEVTQRYAVLRDEMRVLREAMSGADGQFEVAQALLMKMLEATE